MAWTAQGLPHHAAAWAFARPSARRPVAATTPTSCGPSGCGASVVARATRDRVLRYPNGETRRIRYPVAETYDEDGGVGAGGGGGGVIDLGPAPASIDEACWDIATYPGVHSRGGEAASKPRTAAAAAMPALGAAAAPRQPAAPPPQAQPRQQLPQVPEPGGGDAAAPAGAALGDTVAFLDSLFGSSYAAAQPAVDIDHCYKVLDGCPWLVPRPVYVLTVGALKPAGPAPPHAAAGAVAAAGDAAGGSAGDAEAVVGSTYTLRTKVTQEGASGALAQLLGKPHLASSLEVAHMRDSVVTFECCDAAARFATRLEEEGETQVTVAEVDSHRLFRLASDVCALVVLVVEGDDGLLPAPYQLAAALKRQRPLDDM